MILETPASRLLVDGRKSINDTIKKLVLVPKGRDPFGQQPGTRPLRSLKRLYKNIINTELLSLRMLCKGCYRNAIMQCISVVFPFLCRRRKRFKYPTLRVNGFLILFLLLVFLWKKKKRKMDKKLSVFKISENAWTKRKWHGKCDLEHGSETVLRRLVDRPVFRYHPFLHQKDSNKPGKTAVANNSHICLWCTSWPWDVWQRETEFWSCRRPSHS